MSAVRRILFEPKPDITAYELAIIVANLPILQVGGGPSALRVTPIYCEAGVWDQMPSEVQRHWTVQL